MDDNVRRFDCAGLRQLQCICTHSNTVTDEDLRGRNVLHYHPFKLLRDCSISALTPTVVLHLSILPTAMVNIASPHIGGDIQHGETDSISAPHPSLRLALVLPEDQTVLRQAQREPAWLGRRRHKSRFGEW